jgi:nucleoside 2-deoxyribosyltransferase
MKLYICYQFKDSDLIELRRKLEILSEILESKGHHTFIHWRDAQKWNHEASSDFKQIIEEAFEEVKNADAIVVFSNTTDKSEGILLEIGYGIALGKKLVWLTPPGNPQRFVRALSDCIIEYTNLDELEEKLLDTTIL